jgi:DNA-binding NarL/FixJ family response regulator
MTPEESTESFTEQEFRIIFAVCRGLRNTHIAEQCGIGEDTVKVDMFSIFDKLGVSTRAELYLVVRDALNAELRRRLGR